MNNGYFPLLDIYSAEWTNVNTVSEIYIYGKYPESGLFLSVFMGQRENMGQSPGNLEAWV